jgi:peptidoglycan-N-acetylglucosamine deacetylase
MTKSENTVATGHSFVRTLVKDQPGFVETPVLRVVTTSWDDGTVFDLKTAECLAERKLPGTFYVPVKGHYKTRQMAFADAVTLDRKGFEIGAHGISHPNLTECETEQLTIEVEGSKKRLEDALGKEVSMFAYPNGRYNNRVIASVQKVGFIGGRTTAMLARGVNFDPYQMPTSVQVFPHSRLQYFRNMARARDWSRAWGYASRLRCAGNWVALGKLLFDSVLRDGGIWHLYGHSWEIRDLDLWSEFREVLDYVSNRSGVRYLTNGAVVNLRAEKSVGTERCTQLAIL